MVHPKGRLLTFSANIRLDWKGLSWTNTQAYFARCDNNKARKFYNTCGHWSIYFFFVTEKARVFVHDKLFHTSLMFFSKAPFGFCFLLLKLYTSVVGVKKNYEYFLGTTLRVGS